MENLFDQFEIYMRSGESRDAFLTRLTSMLS